MHYPTQMCPIQVTLLGTRDEWRGKSLRGSSLRMAFTEFVSALNISLPKQCSCWELEVTLGVFKEQSLVDLNRCYLKSATTQSCKLVGCCNLHFPSPLIKALSLPHWFTDTDLLPFSKLGLYVCSRDFNIVFLNVTLPLTKQWQM